jgi:hypothetical protein
MTCGMGDRLSVPFPRELCSSRSAQAAGGSGGGRFPSVPVNAD